MHTQTLPVDSHAMQMVALRQALEKAVRAVDHAEAAATQAMADLKLQRVHSARVDSEFIELRDRLALAKEENKRLKAVLADLARDRELQQRERAIESARASDKIVQFPPAEADDTVTIDFSA